VELNETDARTAPVEAPSLRVLTASYEDFYRANYARMVSVAHMLTGSNEAAEDVVQDAFVKLYPRFERVTDPAGYLYRSVVNGCWSRRRRRQVVERYRHLTVPGRAPDTELDETWAALRHLQPRRRAAIVLRYYADLPLAEIARILECRPGTVKSMLHRALADLKEVLDR